MCNVSLQPLKTYLRCHNTNGHHTWQGGDLPREPSTHKLTLHFYHVVLLYHMTKNLYIYTAAMLIAAKLRMVTDFEGLLPIKSHDPLITWSYKIM